MAFVIPAALLLALVLRPELHTHAAEVALFVPALMLAWLLRFFWGYWLALLAFWATRADALLAVQDALVFLLAGQVAPMVLLPGRFRHWRGAAVPLHGRLSGRSADGAADGGELVRRLRLQIGWLLVAIVLYRLVWRVGCGVTPR